MWTTDTNKHNGRNSASAHVDMHAKYGSLQTSAYTIYQNPQNRKEVLGRHAWYFPGSRKIAKICGRRKNNYYYAAKVKVSNLHLVC